MLIIFLALTTTFLFPASAKPNENDGTSSFSTTMDLVMKHGFKGEQHEIVTKDGYYLTIHRILPCNANCTARKKPPVLLQHGILASSKSFVVNGPKSALGYVLSEDCFDVWMPNSRGNVFSRNHTHLSPESEEFWDFSWHEMGIYDLPASIDYILAATNSQKLFYIGHSQAATSYFVMDSLLPSYSNKVVAMTALSPIIFYGQEKSILARFPHIIMFSIEWLWGFREIGKQNGLFYFLSRVLFTNEIPLIKTIGMKLLWGTIGPDRQQYCANPYGCFLKDFPAGSSSKQVLHFCQLKISGKFAPYDYGRAVNLQKYGLEKPPEYPLENGKSRYILWHGPGDYLNSDKDVRKIVNRFPNIYQVIEVPWKHFNHMDFLFAIDAKTLVYDKLIQTINELS